MARLLTAAAVLLAALPEAFVQAGNANPCSQWPYAQLQSYEPAKEWCSSHNWERGAAVPQMRCARGDSLCSAFSGLHADDAKVLCSCIEKPITPTTVKNSPTARTTASISTKANIFTTASCSIATTTVTITPSASIVTITASVSTVTTTVTPTASSTATCPSCSSCPSCTVVASPPAGLQCNVEGIYTGGTLFQLSPAGNTASSLTSCELQCLTTPQCVSISFDGTNCGLYTESIQEQETSGVLLTSSVGQAGAAAFYDSGCFSCA